MLFLDVYEKCLYHLTGLKEIVMTNCVFFFKEASFSKCRKYWIVDAVCYARTYEYGDILQNNDSCQ
jgi:hypothetical protein